MKCWKGRKAAVASLSLLSSSYEEDEVDDEEEEADDDDATNDNDNAIYNPQNSPRAYLPT